LLHWEIWKFGNLHSCVRSIEPSYLTEQYHLPSRYPALDNFSSTVYTLGLRVGNSSKSDFILLLTSSRWLQLLGQHLAIKRDIFVCIDFTIPCLTSLEENLHIRYHFWKTSTLLFDVTFLPLLSPFPIYLLSSYLLALSTLLAYSVLWAYLDGFLGDCACFFSISPLFVIRIEYMKNF
jgi:hypothetical protein